MTKVKTQVTSHADKKGEQGENTSIAGRSTNLHRQCGNQIQVIPQKIGNLKIQLNHPWAYTQNVALSYQRKMINYFFHNSEKLKTTLTPIN